MPTFSYDKIRTQDMVSDFCYFFLEPVGITATKPLNPSPRLLLIGNTAMQPGSSPSKPQLLKYLSGLFQELEE